MGSTSDNTPRFIQEFDLYHTCIFFLKTQALKRYSGLWLQIEFKDNLVDKLYFCEFLTNKEHIFGMFEQYTWSLSW